MAQMERNEKFEALIARESVELQELARTTFYDEYESQHDFEDVDDDEFVRIQDLVANFRKVAV